MARFAEATTDAGFDPTEGNGCNLLVADLVYYHESVVRRVRLLPFKTWSD